MSNSGNSLVRNRNHFARKTFIESKGYISFHGRNRERVLENKLNGSRRLMTGRATKFDTREYG